MEDSVTVSLEAGAIGVGFFGSKTRASGVRWRRTDRERCVDELFSCHTGKGALESHGWHLDSGDGIAMGPHDVVGEKALHRGGPLAVAVREVVAGHVTSLPYRRNMSAR